jgi:RNA polymerase sigma-70 factor, ECF subfamily
MSPSETELHRSFLRRFTAHEPALRAYIRRQVPARADADDIMQEVAIALWEKFSSFREDGSFKAWAFGVARYEILAWLRDRGRDRLVLDEEVVARLADEALDDEPRLARQRAALEFCIEKVAPDQRQLLMLAYSEDQRIQDVAAASGRSIGAFYQWLHRIRRALLDCIHRTLAKETAP